MAQLKQLREAFQIPNNIIIVNSKLFFTPNKPLTRQRQNFDIDNTDNRDPALNYTSLLNTPVYTDILFEQGFWTEQPPSTVRHDFGSNNQGDPNFLRYNAVLVTVSQTKKIIKTEIQGRDGTVKEYIGQDDYQVSVNGIIDSGANGKRPVQEILALKKMLDAPVPIHVTCAYLQMLDIHDLVVESWQMGETEGSYSYQPFSINFLSDIPQELTFK